MFDQVEAVSNCVTMSVKLPSIYFKTTSFISENMHDLFNRSLNCDSDVKVICLIARLLVFIVSVGKYLQAVPHVLMLATMNTHLSKQNRWVLLFLKSCGEQRTHTNAHTIQMQLYNFYTKLKHKQIKPLEKNMQKSYHICIICL